MTHKGVGFQDLTAMVDCGWPLYQPDQKHSVWKIDRPDFKSLGLIIGEEEDGEALFMKHLQATFFCNPYLALLAASDQATNAKQVLLGARRCTTTA